LRGASHFYTEPCRHRSQVPSIPAVAPASRVICYVTSTRKNLEVPMAMDAIRRIYDHLAMASAVESIDLLLHSNGGDGTVPWRLVSLIREFATTRFAVLVPHRAFSAATLTALGADEILMHRMGMLGPTDATVANAFNPRDPAGRPMGISVEDVTAYLALLKDDAGIRHEDELIQGFNILASNVHPLALGNVKRSISQSRLMAKKLLSLHMDPKEEHRIDELVDNLTSKLYYHGHPINRLEAKQVGIPTVQNPSATLEKTIWDLYLEYEREMLLEKSFEMTDEFLAAYPKQQANTPAEITQPADARITYIESTGKTDVAFISYQLVGQTGQNGLTNVTLIIRERGWREE
jgi:hypothetical protein